MSVKFADLQKYEENYNSAMWLINTLPVGINEQHVKNATVAKKMLEKLIKKVDENFSVENCKSLEATVKSTTEWLEYPGVRTTF